MTPQYERHKPFLYLQLSNFQLQENVILQRTNLEHVNFHKLQNKFSYYITVQTS